ncbi:hypothetical protein R50072_00720 [Simiduia litorea]|uniref:D-Ala-D-Ala carboxypeptidase family metallohydrolase n=1 Tax=Simiduia litorea TaxID=1435348 RepID=UPI0036F395D4
MSLKYHLFARYVAFCVALIPAVVEANFDAHRAPFQVALNQRVISYSTSFHATLPGQTINLTFDEKDDDAYSLVASQQSINSKAGLIRYLVPSKKGHYSLQIKKQNSDASIQLQLFVLVPSTEIKNGSLNGYKIGNYPEPLRGLAEYQAPVGYIEVTKDIESLKISPHFTLGQFLCKQASGYPKYIVLRPRLLQKLELFLEDINSKGIRADELVVMSGYRTPHYNRSIGNVSASRHLYGGAADIFVDVSPKNNYMDDVNGDGKVTVADATHLYQIADSLVARTGRKDLTGGVGKYDKTSNHGPFIHIDVRGTKARWSIE